jgi:Uma2 family endonuclease
MDSGTLPPEAAPALDALPRRKFTVDDLDRMLEAGVLDRDEKFELIRGEIVPMSPQLTPHFFMKSRIIAWFNRALAAENFEVGANGTVKLGAGGLFEPDIVVVRRKQRLLREYLPAAEALLIIEVADTSLRRDRDVKAPDYGAAGLPELWIVDLERRETLIWRQTGNGFAQVAVTPFDQSLTPLFEPTHALTIATLE